MLLFCGKAGGGGGVIFGAALRFAVAVVAVLQSNHLGKKAVSAELHYLGSPTAECAAA